MTVIAYCGHEVAGGEEKSYFWKEQNGLSYGVLCSKCVSVYRAVDADSFEDAEHKLADQEPVSLIDILEGTYGGKRTIVNVGGLPFEVYEMDSNKNGQEEYVEYTRDGNNPS